MKFNYRLRRLCGAYYGHQASAEISGAGQWSGSNLVYDSSGNLLISSVSNRVQVLDLKTQTVRTLPVEARSSIRALALSPDDTLLVVVDVNGYGMLVNFRRGIVLHRFGFKRKVRDIKFSPDGRYIAVSQGKNVQVWVTPNHMHKEFAPMVLHRTYTGQADDVTCLCWSSDSSVFAAGSRDSTVRIWTLQTTRGYEPRTLSAHKSSIVGVFFICTDARIEKCYSISRDGALVSWEYTQEGDGSEEASAVEEGAMDTVGDEAVNFFTGGSAIVPSLGEKGSSGDGSNQARKLVNSAWKAEKRHYFDHDGAEVASVSFCEHSQILGVGLSSGVFGLYEMPSVANIHSLSVGAKQLIKACTLNKTGDWLALGCPASQQLLVWEWRSETYVLKQRGHAYGMRCMAYSPDGVVVCTGGEDGKVKLWNSSSGFCYVTMEKTHTAAVTAVAFANSSVVLSASLDGTVRAHDLYRYRTFKTFTSPTPVQFLSLAVDPSGEIVVAGSTDPFHVYAWNMQTAKLLDVFTGHSGPVACMSFQPNGGTLATGSWDGTVKLWDMYKSNTSTESLSHNSDVVCIAYRPDGKEICTGTLRGLLSFWDVESGKLMHEIDGRRDITGGMKRNDQTAAQNNAASRYFTSVCYTADGSCVIAGGNSKFVCIYAVAQQILLKKYQVTFNRSLDGVVEDFNPKMLGDWGPTNVGSDDEGDGGALALPGAKRGDDGSRKSHVEVLTRQIAFSSTGREWSAVSGEGLHVYSLDDDMIFDPIALTEAITPLSVESKLNAREFGLALRMALHLNEFSLVKQVLEATPFASISHVVRSIGLEHLERFMQFIGKIFPDSPHVEFYLQWALEILQTHGMQMEKKRGLYMRAFRALFKAINTRHEELKKLCDENRFALTFLEDHANLVREKAVEGDDTDK
uniref:Small-subunit processome Utp12 domain-containing protein n=1 Tax=Entomoneis paludosa TaxID=265537 RepID=A0A7S2YDT2_9STRA|mmetsp:Transcript_28838/g.60297  ORF Transcript_28838/g.60297 Transcript_28838/m.60297 type:complete len:911 (+) Transcript_28838:68-2800(+)|eukprot:CAMPEP_0172443562 /NCGR_PEP_ID=MMETSP1065-20121228/3789_1 /TAXON_ID=265537 /ORGANISM="Amphiprora paludosa, Strain CCMP125" /LENGTH=910 /DNA_ID=CAMNT_0013193831 /DNA_START=15 /DNA_END=2747 /DNA_ORIENTATION=-